MSFTVTETSRRQGQRFKPERTYDYLYDPLYSVCSEKDHSRIDFMAQTSPDKFKKVPDYKAMFSTLQGYPKHSLQLYQNDPVPRCIDRQWKGYGERNKKALRQMTTHNSSVEVPQKIREDPEVNGRNRYKYFTRPIIPFVQHLPTEVILEMSRGRNELPDHLQELNDFESRTVGVQTDYRENETQTDPYTPEYVVRPGSAPELLTLAMLTWGQGLPAGLAEVEMIERARAKRAWESTLPPLSEVCLHDKRKKMMEDMERNEWAFREKEIEKLQEARMDVLKKLLKQREAKQQEINVKQLDAYWSKYQQKKKMAIKQIRHEHMREIRKLTAKKKNVEGKLERPNLIDNYSNHGSQVYAPIARIGLFPDRDSERFVVKNRFLNTYEGLLEMEAFLPEFVTQPRIRVEKPQKISKEGFIKRAYRHEMELAKLHMTLVEARFKGKESKKPLRYMFKIEKPILRPPTPIVEKPPEGEEERELAIIFLQKLIRGRAVQNMMFEGKEKRIELIRELRVTHALQVDKELLKKAEMQTILALQRERDHLQHKASEFDDHLSCLEGGVLAEMFDFLSKELLRIQAERHIHAFVMLADRQRRMREADESGLRQVEERRRREEDEIFKQVIKVHQTSVDSYLEDILLKSVQNTAEDQAREDIRKMADRINNAAYEIEQYRDIMQSEEIVSKLVHNFLIPEVQKITVRNRVKHFQKRHLLAAHRIIHSETETMLTTLSAAGKAAEDVMELSLEQVDKMMKDG
ncbi:cilia- and flagella-associated protein 91 [Callorhinchus milii]|uniref:cilia- and flagella-associated protein 91 n=1 Tax=Callorhinchus milii TaxID=7868 RepID=UPI001C3FAB8E|nr:cilia- and flagella-associated protein 91 [Callorhinchus milii]